MSQIKITQLTSEQESLISVYREKWSRIALSTETINRDCATQAIKSIYSVMAWEKPEVLFFQSLDDAANNLPSLLESRLNEPLSSLEKPLNRQIERVAGNILMSQFNSALAQDNIPNPNSLNNIERQIYEKIWNEIQIKCWYFGLINIWIIYDNEIKKQIRPILKMLLGKKHEGRL